MKFTQIQAFEKIKAMLGATQQISDRTITDTLETLMSFAGEETELDAFVTSISKTFTSMDGNLRKEVADKAKALEEAAKAKEKTPAQIEAERLAAEAKAKADAEEPAWAKAIRIAQDERMAAFEAKLVTAETAKSIAQIRDAALAKAKVDKVDDRAIAFASKNFDWTKTNADVQFAADCLEGESLFGVKPLAGGKTDIAPDYEAIKKLHGLEEKK